MICLESWAILIHIADFGWISQRFGVMYFPLSHAILLLSSYYLRYTVFMMIEILPTILSVTCKHTEYHHVGTSLLQAFTHSQGSPSSPEGSTGHHIFSETQCLSKRYTHAYHQPNCPPNITPLAITNQRMSHESQLPPDPRRWKWRSHGFKDRYVKCKKVRVISGEVNRVCRWQPCRHTS